MAVLKAKIKAADNDDHVYSAVVMGVAMPNLYGGIYENLSVGETVYFSQETWALFKKSKVSPVIEHWKENIKVKKS